MQIVPLDFWSYFLGGKKKEEKKSIINLSSGEFAQSMPSV